MHALCCSPHTFWIKRLLVLRFIESELFEDSGLLTPPAADRLDAKIDAVGALWRAAVDVEVCVSLSCTAYGTTILTLCCALQMSSSEARPFITGMALMTCSRDGIACTQG